MWEKISLTFIELSNKPVVSPAKDSNISINKKKQNYLQPLLKGP